MMPYCASRNTMGTPRFVPNQLSTRCDCAVTSGPMPSPPTTATLIMLDRSFMHITCCVLCKMDPGPFRPVGRLEGADFVVALQCQRDFVETFQQALAPARIDCKIVPLSRRRNDRLLLQVDADAPCPLALLDVSRKAIDD